MGLRFAGAPGGHTLTTEETRWKQFASDMKALADLLLLSEDAGADLVGSGCVVAPVVCIGSGWGGFAELLRLWNASDAPNLPANVRAAMDGLGQTIPG